MSPYFTAKTTVYTFTVAKTMYLINTVRLFFSQKNVPFELLLDSFRLFFSLKNLVLYAQGCNRISSMAVRVVEFSSGGYKIRKVFA